MVEPRLKDGKNFLIMRLQQKKVATAEVSSWWRNQSEWFPREDIWETSQALVDHSRFRTPLSWWFLHYSQENFLPVHLTASLSLPSARSCSLNRFLLDQSAAIFLAVMVSNHRALSKARNSILLGMLCSLFWKSLSGDGTDIVGFQVCSHEGHWLVNISLPPPSPSPSSPSLCLCLSPLSFPPAPVSLSPLSLSPLLSHLPSPALSPLFLSYLAVFFSSLSIYFLLLLSSSLSLSISCLSLLFNSIVFSSPLSFIHSLSFPNLFSLSPLLPPLICVLSHKCPSSTVYLSSPLFSFISLSLVSLPLCFSLYHTAIGKFPPLLPWLYSPHPIPTPPSKIYIEIFIYIYMWINGWESMPLCTSCRTRWCTLPIHGLLPCQVPRLQALASGDMKLSHKISNLL